MFINRYLNFISIHLVSLSTKSSTNCSFDVPHFILFECTSFACSRVAGIYRGVILFHKQDSMIRSGCSSVHHNDDKINRRNPSRRIRRIGFSSSAAVVAWIRKFNHWWLTATSLMNVHQLIKKNEYSTCDPGEYSQVLLSRLKPLEFISTMCLMSCQSTHFHVKHHPTSRRRTTKGYHN